MREEEGVEGGEDKTSRRSWSEFSLFVASVHQVEDCIFMYISSRLRVFYCTQDAHSYT